jgi:hypothetical protein
MKSIREPASMAGLTSAFSSTEAEREGGLNAMKHLKYFQLDFLNQFIYVILAGK